VKERVADLRMKAGRGGRGREMAEGACWVMRKYEAWLDDIKGCMV